MEHTVRILNSKREKNEGYYFVQSNIVILESANRELPTVAVAVHLQTEPLAFLCIGAKVVLVDIFNSGSKFLFLHLLSSSCLE